ncbi:VWA-like domain-containing protein [Clostridium sp.]|uniref:vWA domain-containing protein n=1 Tax=Clostridium sp. TaxID=1506 RepID=UPI002630DD69|nr:VWA-like domain-containing protein [Clostridium sp.]
MDFERTRRKLLNIAIDAEEENKELTEDFNREFWNLIEKVIISLYDKENSFFGQFLIHVKRIIRKDIKWPIATKPEVGHFTMAFNPRIILECDLKEMQALLKHEVYHIMMSHYDREKALSRKYSKLAVSIAMDIAINQYIKNLPSYSKRLDYVNLEYNIDLKQDMPMEKYAEEIQKAIERRKKYGIVDKDGEANGLVDQGESHEVWEEVSLSLDSLEGLTKKTAINAYKGKAPKDLEKIILLMKEKPEIKWSEFLKKILPTTRGSYRKTITRKDRRFPERLDLRGKLPSSIPKILIAIDVSASISDKEFENIIVEVLGIVKNKSAEIKVIECDDEIRRVYNLKGIKDIKPRSKKNGSTKFSPVFRYIKENNMRNHILVYFTDGVGEKELEVKPINYRTLWVITGDEKLSLQRPFGIVKHIAKNDSDGYTLMDSLQEMKDNLNDWAR